MAVNLLSHLPDVFNVGFTATMEEELDGIEEGKQEWHRVARTSGTRSRRTRECREAEQGAPQEVEEATSPVPQLRADAGEEVRAPRTFLAPRIPRVQVHASGRGSELPVPVPAPAAVASLVARNGPSADSSTLAPPRLQVHRRSPRHHVRAARARSRSGHQARCRLRAAPRPRGGQVRQPRPNRWRPRIARDPRSVVGEVDVPGGGSAGGRPSA